VVQEVQGDAGQEHRDGRDHALQFDAAARDGQPAELDRGDERARRLFEQGERDRADGGAEQVAEAELLRRELGLVVQPPQPQQDRAEAEETQHASGHFGR
jgi:hypothetical protein